MKSTKVSHNNNSMVKKDDFAIGNCCPFFYSHTLNIKVLLKILKIFLTIIFINFKNNKS
jgi:hypothetical protein